MDRIPDQILFEQYLATRDEPCPGCGYNLRGLIGSTCPECGQPLRLHVGLVEPKRGPFLTGLIGLSAGTGFSGLLLVYFIFVVMTRLQMTSQNYDDVAVLIGQTLCGAVLLTIWIRSARRIRRMTMRRQWSLAIACCLTAPLYLVIFSLVVD